MPLRSHTRLVEAPILARLLRRPAFLFAFKLVVMSATVAFLPRVPGPKLGPFTPTGQARIKFIKNLGSPRNADSNVWKVKIDGRLYALKMFRFKTVEYLERCHAFGKRPPLAHRQFYVDYYDPFNCECRAYGRLKEAGREDLAVRAHGYLMLSPEQEAEVTTKMGRRYLSDFPDNWGAHSEHRSQPVRAIVKDLVTDEEEEGRPMLTTEDQARQAWADLKALHALGICARDIHQGNYLGGKLVDFSRAWTMYHPGLMSCSTYRLAMLRMREARMLVSLFEKWEFAIPRDLKACAVHHFHDADPTSYDWRKGDEVAGAHVDGQLYKKWPGFSVLFDTGRILSKL